MVGVGGRHAEAPLRGTPPRLEAVSPRQWMSEAPQGQRPVAAAQAAAELS